jgi:hypothetical protein
MTCNIRTLDTQTTGAAGYFFWRHAGKVHDEHQFRRYPREYFGWNFIHHCWLAKEKNVLISTIVISLWLSQPKIGCKSHTLTTSVYSGDSCSPTIVACNVVAPL